jgi:predicted deacylase
MSDATLTPDVTTHGPGEPKVAIVGGIHGDEPSGVRAVERLRTAARADDLDLRAAIKLVIANPPAIAAGKRYLDSDMNRSFPGDPEGNREQRLAARLAAETEGLITLSLHSTHSQDDPMALFDRSQRGMLDIAAGLPVPYVVDHHSVASGSYTEVNDVVTVESGWQGTEEAAVEAEKLAIDFLRLTDVLDGEPKETETGFFSMRDPVPKPPSDAYEFLAENFELVEAGTVFARAGAVELVADESFYPILMSAVGYATIFGYKGIRLGGSVAEAVDTLGALGTPVADD